MFVGAAFRNHGSDNYGRLIDGTSNTGFWLGRNATNILQFGGGCVEPNPPYGQFKAVVAEQNYVISAVRSGATTTMRLDGGSPTTRGTSGAAMSGALALLNDATLSFDSANFLYRAVILVKSVSDLERQLCERWLAEGNGVTL